MTAKLAVVIHAEEEFDWNGGFKSTNQSMTHHQELIQFVDELLAVGAKVTLAMDFPFISSQGGAAVVEKYRKLADSKVEFATHLHPWVNPPFEEQNTENEVVDVYSYPGNLPKNLEYNKLMTLTEKIESVSGIRPVTYLAGRYGIGKNTAQHLIELGYQIDLSISAYCDFSAQEGPDFSGYGNTIFEQDALVYVPHTCSILSAIPFIQNYANRHPELFTRWQNNLIKKAVGKCLRLRRYRLSPEGFTLRQMQQLTYSQQQIGQNEFVLSLHSPSLKPALTPYVRNHKESKLLVANTRDYVRWFIDELGGQTMLPRQLAF